MREEMARQKNDEWKAIDSEIREHPAPKDSDGNVLSRRLVGKWSSPRHDYLYPSDGSWTMLRPTRARPTALGASREISFLRLLALARLTRLSTRSSSSQKRICNCRPIWRLL
jgi:hypothetical protein